MNDVAAVRKPFDLEANRVLPLARVAQICGICVKTIRRYSELGTGPKITRLSPRRIGVRVVDLQTWMDSAGEKVKPRPPKPPRVYPKAQ